MDQKVKQVRDHLGVQALRRMELFHSGMFVLPWMLGFIYSVSLVDTVWNLVRTLNLLYQCNLAQRLERVDLTKIVKQSYDNKNQKGKKPE